MDTFWSFDPFLFTKGNRAILKTYKTKENPSIATYSLLHFQEFTQWTLKPYKHKLMQCWYTCFISNRRVGQCSQNLWRTANPCSPSVLEENPPPQYTIISPKCNKLKCYLQWYSAVNEFLRSIIYERYSNWARWLCKLFVLRFF